ncbi:MAG: CcmD family protein [Bacteroidota bacterium]
MVLFTLISYSQQEVEMADKFYTEGKVYVVVIVVSVLVVGMLAYLFLMDRKISRLEKEVQNKKSH